VMEILPDAGSTGFGSAFTSIGDFNQDGVGDLVAGSQGEQLGCSVRYMGRREGRSLFLGGFLGGIRCYAATVK
jgi:FG-GAP repeat